LDVRRAFMGACGGATSVAIFCCSLGCSLSLLFSHFILIISVNLHILIAILPLYGQRSEPEKLTFVL